MQKIAHDTAGPSITSGHCAEPPSDAPPMTPAAAASSKRSRFDARILLVEDNAVNRDLAASMLERMGCRTTTAADGIAALQRVAQGAFDLVLMDCEMPVMDGFQATRDIRQSEAIALGIAGSEGKPLRIPIIALTAHSASEIRRQCLAAGMDDVLGKPIGRAQLIDCLQRWLPLRASALGADAPAPPGAETIDRRATDALRRFDASGDHSVLARVVEQFATIAPRTAAAIRAAAETSELEVTWRAAHTLRSSAAWLGANDVARYCEEIEASARSAGVVPAGSLLDHLDSAIAAALPALRLLSGVAP
jgi:CheY-like chemotaxis protein/HPt (histidine-containing phosphotransfer) domain-containing protein